MSSSKPKMPCLDPNETPQFTRFSSQFDSVRQFAESPPKLNPTNGVKKPSA
jgi:hypothetical protein